MTASSQLMMVEIPESEAHGELAQIYEELRLYCAVPYVSSLQRHVATMPGCLEYVWAALRPVFLNGSIQETAWRLAAIGSVAPLPPLSSAALRLLGVDADGIRSIRNICDNFVRVAPINLLFAGCIGRLLAGVKPGGEAVLENGWQPPAMLAPMPALLNAAAASDGVRAVLMQLASQIGERSMVPGLYRLLAHWPAYLAHVATLIEPLLKNDSARAERQELAARIVAAADEVLAGLPPLSTHYRPPSAAHRRAIIAAIHTYRGTSPEMIVVGTLLRDALPVDGAP
jgi:hypothetical protein